MANSAPMHTRPDPEWELGQRRYIREKVVTLYEAVFQDSMSTGAYQTPSEAVWRELFVLKVNHHWLRQCVLAVSEDDILGPRKALFRDVFARSMSVLHSDDPVCSGHALQTFSAVLGALGLKTFADPGADTLEVVCGISNVEAFMSEFLTSLRLLLNTQELVKQRAAVTALLTAVCVTTNVNQNFLLEFIIQDEALATAILALLHRQDRSLEARALKAQALKLIVVLSAFHKYEESNAFLRFLHNSTQPGDVTCLLATPVWVLESIINEARKPSGAQAADPPALNPKPDPSSASFSTMVYSALQRGLAALTLDQLVAAGRVNMNDLLDAAGCSGVLCATLAAYEVIAGAPRHFGAGFFTHASDERSQGGSRAAKTNGKVDRTPDISRESSAGVAEALPHGDRTTVHCSALRALLTLASLASLEVKRPQVVLVLRLSLLAIMSACANGKVVEAMHTRTLGGKLTIWRIERGAPVARTTTDETSLAGALLEVLTHMLSQNLRRSQPSEAFSTGLLIAQRIMLWENHAGARLADAPWRLFWQALLQSLLHLSSCDHIPDGDGPGSWTGLCLQHLVVINLVLIHGASFLPQAALQQQFAYEIVRLHRDFEKLFKLGKHRDPSGQLVDALALVRRIIVMTLDKLDAPSGPSHSQVRVMTALRELQLEVEPHLASSLQKWQLPPENPSHVAFFQAVTRALVTGFRADSTLDFIEAAA
mmetsp:Transcript_25216/g.68300  ORF Transcript_25216/g.68300 Transcript_25216/m.68300 type:complete len:711 (-) Transcript_25216:237-2369(-)